MMMAGSKAGQSFPWTAGIMFSHGLGGFFDGNLVQIAAVVNFIDEHNVHQGSFLKKSKGDSCLRSSGACGRTKTDETCGNSAMIFFSIRSTQVSRSGVVSSSLNSTGKNDTSAP
ncbi:hypothetical protein ACDY97_02315 [Rhizobium mongolense]|uniref:hypothetical protein n=1 Tax=Rhizobium mongolense TaxID=57676 RepID=UPI003557C9A0